MSKMYVKRIVLQFPSGEVWSIDATEIANNKANYYADKEKTCKERNDVYSVEYLNTIKNEDELIDWMFNNMNWNDIKGKFFVCNINDESSVEKNICEAEVREIIRSD